MTEPKQVKKNLDKGLFVLMAAPSGGIHCLVSPREAGDHYLSTFGGSAKDYVVYTAAFDENFNLEHRCEDEGWEMVDTYSFNELFEPESFEEGDKVQYDDYGSMVFEVVKEYDDEKVYDLKKEIEVDTHFEEGLETYKDEIYIEFARHSQLSFPKRIDEQEQDEEEEQSLIDAISDKVIEKLLEQGLDISRKEKSETSDACGGCKFCKEGDENNCLFRYKPCNCGPGGINGNCKYHN